MRDIRRRILAFAGMFALLTGTIAAVPAAAAQAAPSATSAQAPGPGGPTIGRAAKSLAAQQREVWYGYWYPGQVCNGDTCSVGSTDDLPHFWISGQNFNNGNIYVGIFNRDGTPIVSTTVRGGVWQGFVAYAWGWKANMIDCAAIGAPVHDNAFIQAKDLTNNLWSNRIFVTTDCYVL